MVPATKKSTISEKNRSWQQKLIKSHGNFTQSLKNHIYLFTK